MIFVAIVGHNGKVRSLEVDFGARRRAIADSPNLNPFELLQERVYHDRKFDTVMNR